MKTLGKLLVAALVLGAFCMWLMFNGHWGGVISFTSAVFGQQVADGVDDFGNLSKDVGDDVVDYGAQLQEQIRNGETVTPDWGSIGQAIGSLAPTTSERHPSYARDQFGSRWPDVDGNGCDTRNDVLTRDLTAITRSSDGCTVLTGTLDDPYTGKTIAFTRGAATSADVQIDHIVPLALAWDEGAWKWTAQKREAFANDPANLLAVDGSTNTSKWRSSIAEWLPPADQFHCTYVALYVAVHDKYDLAMSGRDKAEAEKLITSCS